MTRPRTYGPAVIHKFDVAISDTPTVLSLSPSAQVVHVARQADAPHGVIQLWALLVVKPDGTTRYSDEGRRFVVHGTGHPIAGAREHVGTVIDGPFVWHVFEDVSARAQA